MKINLKRKIFALTFLTFFTLFTFLPVLSFAQNTISGDPVKNSATGDPKKNSISGDPTISNNSGKIENPLAKNGITDLNSFIKTILEGMIKICIPVIALAIIYSGFLFVSARGNAESLKTAKSALTYTLIGAAILLGSWAIAQLISNTILAL